ncbi:hypothetical protein D3C78_965360 [compost metagenome]
MWNDFYPQPGPIFACIRDYSNITVVYAGIASLVPSSFVFLFVVLRMALKLYFSGLSVNSTTCSVPVKL